MFSSIIELFQKIQEFKLRKQRKETREEIKKQENKILKKDKLVGAAKEKAKNTKSVQNSKEEENKLKLKVLLLRVLKWFVEIIESFIAFIISLVGVMGFFVILVVLVLMIAIYGLLHIDLSVGPGGIYEGSSSTDDDCIQSDQAITNTDFDLDAIGSLMGTLTDYEKNLYKALSLYTEILKDTSVLENPDNLNSIIQVLGKETVVKFLFGFSAVETGMNFENGNRDILKYPSTIDKKYAFLGLHRDNYFDGKYQYNGRSNGDGVRVLKDSFVTSWKSKYQPIETPIHENNYVPYGIATQTGSFATTYIRAHFSNVSNSLPEIMDAYGIEANRDKLVAFSQLFAASGYYHSDYGSMNELSFSLWCALWSATSDVDSQRSFDNIKIIYSNKTDYSESTARKAVLGTSSLEMVYGNISIEYFEINGEKITLALWDWVGQNCSNPEYFEQTAKVWFENCKNGVYDASETILNGHYGLIAYLMGNRVVKDLGGSVPVTSGGNPQDCECYESGSLGDIDLSGVVEGQAQGPWDAELLEKINNRQSTSGYGSFKQYFGKDFVNPSNSEKAESWRVGSKWKVPYYYQSNSAGIKFASNGLRYHNSIGSLNACGTYMLAYLMSAATGKLINPIEAFAVGLEFGIFLQNGNMSYAQTNLDKLKPYGINITYLPGNGTTNKAKVDECLENGGIVGIRSQNANNKFVGTEHFFVITEKVGDKYNVYAATGFDRDTETTHTWSEVTLGAVLFFTVDNVSRSTVEDTQLTSYHETNFTLSPGEAAIIPTGSEDINYTKTNSRSYESWEQNWGWWQKDFVEAVGGQKYDEYGLGKVNGRYVVAVVAHVGVVGDYIDVYQEDGTVIPCIVGDCKSFDDWTYRFAQVGNKTLPNGKLLSYGHLSGMGRYDSSKGTPPSTSGLAQEEPYGNPNCDSTNIIEHMIDPDFASQFSSAMSTLGFNKNITKIVNLGSYFTNPNLSSGSVVSNSNNCIDTGSTVVSSADNMTTDISDLPGGVVRPHSVTKNGVVYTEPDAPIWDSSRGENPYEVEEYFYAYDKVSGYRLGMWPKDYNLAPVTVSKEYNEFIWPCDSTMQGTGYEHEGADLHAHCYTPIYAPADGTITRSDWGNTKNVGTWESAYCVNFKLDNPVTYNGKIISDLWLGHFVGIRYRVQSGGTGIHVTQGELLGWVGYANAPHLHITLDYDADIYTDAITKFYNIGYNEFRKAGS